MICGQAHMVGLLPVFGVFSISSKIRGLPRPCSEDSTANSTTSRESPARRIQ